MNVVVEHRMPARVATALVLGITTAVLLTALFAFPRIEAFYISRSQDEGRATLRLVSGAVHQAIGRYDPVPRLIAGEPKFRELLLESDNDGVVPFVNEKLRLTALSVAASEIYVMDTTGLTIASSNYREATSFVGQNFAFRPYFKRALAGESAQFHAVGAISGERGFFFAAPILDGIDVIGVLALKVSVDALEGAWDGLTREIIVADQNGVAFLSSSAKYRLRSLAALSEGAKGQIEDTRQYPLDNLTTIPFSASVISPGAVEVRLGEDQDETRYLADSEPLELAGWHAIVLSPLEPVRSEAISALVFFSLATTAAALAVLVLIQRRAGLLERVRIEKFQRDLLERMVKERTADLDAANTSLKSEVVERRNAEMRLRKTQKDLIQAGKLAALGQMSAALSHEINQPLAAVKSYADNAAAYLERQRLEEVGANITRISAMADRMARISGHLRNFARQPGDTLKPVPVCDVIREAIALIEPQLRKSGTHVSFRPLDADVWAIGGRLRLQQVLVNVMANAIDAMSRQEDRRIEIGVLADANTLSIQLRDHGPGLSNTVLDQAFEAFFTTKDAGEGMGLGLSISYNIIEDFGGSLSAENHPDGGAVFAVKLRRAPDGQLPKEAMVAE